MPGRFRECTPFCQGSGADSWKPGAPKKKTRPKRRQSHRKGREHRKKLWLEVVSFEHTQHILKTIAYNLKQSPKMERYFLSFNEKKAQKKELLLKIIPKR